MRNLVRPAVARNILAEMARSGVSQRDLGREIGISQAALSRRLAGDVPLRLDELQAIAAHLEVPLEELLKPAAEEATA